MCKKVKVHKSICILCFKSLDNSMSFLSWIFRDDEVCYECRVNLNSELELINVMGMKVMCLYRYEGYARDCILRYKDGKDRWIAKVFMNHSIGIKYRNHVVVYVPSSAEAVLKRGFKHNELLVKSVFSNVVDDCFIKLSDFKQSELSLRKRGLVSESMVRNKDVVFENTKILLFDDIITTGNSLRACYDILCKEGYKVDVLALFAVRS